MPSLSTIMKGQSWWKKGLFFLSYAIAITMTKFLLAINLAQLHAVAHIRDLPRGLHANNCGEIPMGLPCIWTTTCTWQDSFAVLSRLDSYLHIACNYMIVFVNTCSYLLHNQLSESILGNISNALLSKYHYWQSLNCSRNLYKSADNYCWP